MRPAVFSSTPATRLVKQRDTSSGFMYEYDYLQPPLANARPATPNSLKRDTQRVQVSGKGWLRFFLTRRTRLPTSDFSRDNSVPPSKTLNSSGLAQPSHIWHVDKRAPIGYMISNAVQEAQPSWNAQLAPSYPRSPTQSSPNRLTSTSSAFAFVLDALGAGHDLQASERPCPPFTTLPPRRQAVN